MQHAVAHYFDEIWAWVPAQAPKPQSKAQWEYAKKARRTLKVQLKKFLQRILQRVDGFQELMELMPNWPSCVPLAA